MRNYRSNAASDVRIDYGVALVRGLWNFEKTRPHSEGFKALNDALEAQYRLRLGLRKPWLEARQDVRFGDINADDVIRSYQSAAHIADGGRRGAISKAVLSEGSTPVTAPSGARQLPALIDVIRDLDNARVEGIDAFRTAERPKLEAARLQLQTAVDTYQSARAAYHDAFAIEKGLRDEHRLAVDAMMGTVRHAFPGDKRRQDAVFPDATVTRGIDKEDNTDTDGDDTDTE
jgi:hypothetical protein